MPVPLFPAPGKPQEDQSPKITTTTKTKAKKGLGVWIKW
jgi:hypothetical protein